MKRSRALATATLTLLLVTGTNPGAHSGPLDGWSSSNVEFIRTVPLGNPVASLPIFLSGMTRMGKYLYVTGSELTIFDISDPTDPRFLSELPLEAGYTLGEDPSTNGTILLIVKDLFASSSELLVVDVSNKTRPTILATLPGDHTVTCVQRCKWAYGSSGTVYDLRNPARPRVAPFNWTQLIEARSATPVTVNFHNVTEVAPGLVLTASVPMYLLNVDDPLAPKVIARSDGSPYSFGEVAWPRAGRDRFAFSSGEPGLVGIPNCGTRDAARGSSLDGGFKSWAASDASEGGFFTGIDEYFASDGTFTDGSPPASVGLFGNGCYASYFDVHPQFHNGGLVALAHANYGVKFLLVSPSGTLSEIGFWLPSSAAYAGPQDVAWITDDIVYSVTRGRGLDVLRFDGKPESKADAL